VPRSVQYGFISSSPLLFSDIFIELSSKFIYLHSLYTAVLDMYAMISLYSYLMSCMVRRVNLVP
jgi:hypothetical protein